MDDQRAHAYWVILASFFFALVLALIPLPRWLLQARPEWVALVLIYWSMALPHRVGLATALCLGVIVDVLEGALLGQNAMALVVLALLSLMLYQRIRVFNLWQQAGVIFVLIGIHQMVCQWVQKLEGLGARSLVFLLPALTSALLWPLILHSLRRVRRAYRVS
ncbi:rod shape-determining protein MreD [Mangrovimicrobium sediminis]|uniref:Rod shape-determining protein MreD n=1 Tax=Mangrovimicrobium sediminis TaxID=2562682 RepID=A0A4Z0LXJ5_9GAMM|nr:rod shape-determining protein MreD [Haliea sp. SAOS-164]TGD72093.1 rod shape-determining protein MreD [Haliea sp. SAOS-164]